MSSPDEQQQEARARVPFVVVLVTFLGFWALGGYLLVAEQGGEGRVSVLAIAVLCFAFPFLSFQGIAAVMLEGMRAFFRRLGGNGR